MATQEGYTHICITEENRERINTLKDELGLTQDGIVEYLLDDYREDN